MVGEHHFFCFLLLLRALCSVLSALRFSNPAFEDDPTDHDASRTREGGQ